MAIAELYPAGRARTLIGRNDMARLELPTEVNDWRFCYAEDNGDITRIQGLVHVTVRAGKQLLIPFLPLTIEGNNLTHLDIIIIIL